MTGLRERLVRLRDELRGEIAGAETVEAAWVHLLASTEIALAALPDDDDTRCEAGAIRS